MFPATEPRRPRIRIGPESGTATRLVNTPTMETSSKVAATMGDVAIWAARETEMRFDSCLGGLFSGLSKGRSSRDFRGLVSRSIPDTADTERWKPVL